MVYLTMTNPQITPAPVIYITSGPLFAHHASKISDINLKFWEKDILLLYLAIQFFENNIQ